MNTERSVGRGEGEYRGVQRDLWFREICGDSLLTPGQPVPALTLQFPAPGRVSVEASSMTSLTGLDLRTDARPKREERRRRRRRRRKEGRSDERAYEVKDAGAEGKGEENEVKG